MRESSEGILEDLSAPSQVLAIAFGGMMMRLDGLPPFEFFRVLDSVTPAKKLFLRDQSQAYYHHGIPGLGDDIAEVATGIHKIAERTGALKLVMLGNSGGGYAALLFGRLLGADEVHAFAPTTFILPELRDRYDDHRFENRWAALMESGRYQAQYGDLRRFFEDTPPRDTRFVIHYCSTYELDVVHAEWLANDPEVELRPYETGDHGLVRRLRETGELTDLLSTALTVDR